MSFRNSHFVGAELASSRHLDTSMNLYVINCTSLPLLEQPLTSLSAEYVSFVTRRGDGASETGTHGHCPVERK